MVIARNVILEGPAPMQLGLHMVIQVQRLNALVRMTVIVQLQPTFVIQPTLHLCVLVVMILRVKHQANVLILQFTLVSHNVHACLH